MPTLAPVDHDPFAESSAPPQRLVPVENDPFAQKDYGNYDKPTPLSPPVPLTDDPNKTYGAVLPFARDNKSGKIEFAVPEFLRAPIRGIIEGGQQALGERPVNDPATRSDITAAASALGVGREMLGEPAKPPSAPDNPMGFTTQPPLGTQLAAGRVQRRMDAETKAPTKAAELLEKRLADELKASGKKPEEITAELQRLRETYPNKQITILDIAAPGGPVESLGSALTRKDGATGGIINRYLKSEDAAAPQQLQADTSLYLTAGSSSRATAKALIDARQAEAQPLYDKAFEGGSIAPLKDQFETALSESVTAERSAAKAVAAAQDRVEAAQAKKTQTGGNVYSESAANDDLRTASRDLFAAQRQQAQAIAAKQGVLEKLRLAQADIANETPGAVWNPRIQQFLDDPILKRGMARGVEIQRLEALAKGEPFDPTELAISPEGEVVRVPNMRTLDAGKKGLDAIIESEGRDEWGRLNQFGRAVNEVRKAYLAELDAVNPDYATARASWSGHSASLDALKFGKNLSRHSPEEIAETWADMNENDREFVRLGKADDIREKIGKTGFSGDEAKAIVRNEWTKQQLRPIFKSEQDFERYVEAVRIQNEKFARMNRMVGNSATAKRLADDKNFEAEAAGDAARALVSAYHGNPVTAVQHGIRAFQNWRATGDQEVNDYLAQILTDLNLTPTVANGALKITPPSPRQAP